MENLAVTAVMRSSSRTNLVDVSDVHIDIGGAEQSHPQQCVEGPQRTRRRSISTPGTGRRLRRPPTRERVRKQSTELKRWQSYV